MFKNPGILREEEFVHAFDGKKIDDLGYNQKHMLRQMFGIFDPEKTLKAELVDGFQKPDIWLEYDGQRKYISIKSGKAVVVGMENVKKFIRYLREWHLSEESQKTILLFHFGDGTVDGSGKERYDMDLFRVKLKKRIEALNEELNDNPEFVKEFVERYLFKGTQPNYIPADYIYFGDVNFGTICSKTQVMKHIGRRARENHWRFLFNPHVGPLLFRPHARYTGKEIKDESKRWEVNIYWANLFADLSYIAQRYDG